MKTYTVSVIAYVDVKAKSREEALIKIKKKLGCVRPALLDQIEMWDPEVGPISAIHQTGE